MIPTPTLHRHRQLAGRITRLNCGDIRQTLLLLSSLSSLSRRHRSFVCRFTGLMPVNVLLLLLSLVTSLCRLRLLVHVLFHLTVAGQHAWDTWIYRTCIREKRQAFAAESCVNRRTEPSHSCLVSVGYYILICIRKRQAFVEFSVHHHTEPPPHSSLSL